MGTRGSARSPDRRKSYRRRALTGDILVTLLWASGAAAAGLFLASGGAEQFTTVDEAFTSVGIVAGLVGTDFILVMLVLAARIPLLDRTIGHDRAIAVHRSLGKPALYLLLAHAALLIAGYAIHQKIDPVTETVRLWNTADFPLAFIGLGLLLVVVLSSLIAVRRKFSYEAWHLIHLLSYVAVLFAVPHQLSAGGVLSDGSVERAFWICLYAFAFGAIGFYRFVEPSVSSLRHRLRVSAVETLAPGVFSLHLSGQNLHILGAAGGQFFIWRFWTRRTWWHSHPISLSAVPGASSARITVRNLGTGSAQLGSLRIGTRVSLEGPYGIFTDAARTAPRLAVIAAGIGVTPVRALLEQSNVAPGEAVIVLRASSSAETYLWPEIASLAAQKGATLYTMVGPRPESGDSWMTAADSARGVTLASVFPMLRESDLYLCGPTAWLDLVESDALETGIPPHQVHAERFDW